MGQRAPAINHREIVYRYVNLFERILQRPLVTPEEEKTRKIKKNGLTKTSDSQAVSYPKAWSTNPHVQYNEQISNQAIAPI